jgi:NADH:ubiquinone reductase (H+-translocating)
MTTLVLGAGYAGLLAALRISRRTDVTLVDANYAFSERIRLHQRDTPPARSYAEWTAHTNVRFVQARATAIDAARRAVETTAGTLAYDRLVVALGSRVDRSLPGALEHANVLDDRASATALHAAMAAGAERVTVIGGGLTAIEAASELAESYPHARVTIACAGGFGDAVLGPRGLAHAKRFLDRHGVTIAEQLRIDRIERSCAIAGGRELAHDACVLCAGFVAPSLARESGLAVDARGRMLVDAHVRCLAYPEIVGIGDAAVCDARMAPLLMSCRVAMPMAIYAADAPNRPFRVRDVLRCMSLGRRDGVVQFHRKTGELRRGAITGKAAAWVKEQICRYTVARIETERRRAAKLPALAAETA